MLPPYDPAAFDSVSLARNSVVVTRETLAPTGSPAPILLKGATTAAEVKEAEQFVEASAAFPISELDLYDSNTGFALRLSMVRGVAYALGFESEDHITIASVAGEPFATGSRRRAAADTIVTFHIMLLAAFKSATDIAQLEENIKTASSTGAIVANIQKQAMENGVLTTELLAMQKVLRVHTRIKHKTPASSVVKYSASAKPGGESSFEVDILGIGAGVGGMLFLVLLRLFISRRGNRQIRSQIKPSISNLGKQSPMLGALDLVRGAPEKCNPLTPKSKQNLSAKSRLRAKAKKFSEQQNANSSGNLARVTKKENLSIRTDLAVRVDFET
jgi:hypothetical protein